MQENEFERQVQEEMSRLRLQPSASVWPNVEKELKGKKRRRVVFYFLLASGLVLLGYFGTRTFQKDNEQAQVSKLQESSPDQLPSKKTHTATPQADKPISPAEAEKIDKRSENFSEHPVAKAKAPLNINQRATTSNTSNLPVDKDRFPGQGQLITQHHNIKSSPGIVKNSDKRKEIDPSSGVNEKDRDRHMQLSPEISAPEGTPKLPDQQNHSNARTNNIDTAVATLSTPVTESVQSKNDTTAIADTAIARTESLKEMPSNKRSSKWKFGIEVSGGMTFNRKKAFSFSPPESTMDYMVYYSPPVAGGANSFGRIILSPSSVEPGIAFKLGVNMERQLSKRSSILTGLRYSYLSDRIKVGQRKDTLILTNLYQSNRVESSIYNGTQERTYVNQYHFIELPLTYQWRVNKGKTVPILFNAGISAAYLFSTNGLVYDTAAGGIYYRSSDVFNKLHVNLNTGFQFRFGNNAKLQWSLGPDLAFDMRKLLERDVFTEKRYLLYGGITGRIYFNKKNSWR